MNRRQLIALMGALGGGGAIATGTGAFSSTQADRSVSVSVSGDKEGAYLRIGPSNPDLTDFINPDGSSGKFSIDLGADTDNGGSGVNARAVTTFENLFEIQNQGTQEVEVDISPLAFSAQTGSAPALTLQVPSSEFPTFTLEAGGTEKITIIAAVDEGFSIDPNDAEIEDNNITITAEST